MSSNPLPFYLSRFFFIFSVIIGLLPGIHAQRPSTNIYLFNLNLASSSQPMSQPRLLTGFNKDGYNNQPAFFQSDEVWFTSDFQDSSQTDIWSLQTTSGKRRRITQTRVSEYSPTPMPGGNSFSTVVVELDGKNTQRLWEYPMLPGRNPVPLFPEVTGVGYHCWLSMDSAALFIVGEPHNLHFAHPSLDQSTFFVSRIGRCLIRDPKGRLWFIQKVTDTDWYIKRYDPQYDMTEIVIKCKPGSEDFCLLPDGSLLMAEGSIIYRYDPSKDITWRTFSDLSVYGLMQITRLANQADQQIAIVNQPVNK